jgi:hypothetical protein
VTREAIANGYDACPVTSVPAADVEGAVLDQVHRLLAAPELVARTWARRRSGGGMARVKLTSASQTDKLLNA